MSAFIAKKAKRTRRPLKVSMEGVSGGGKTMTALRIAYDMKRHGIGKNIVVFDTENESAGLYAGMEIDGERWDFMHVDMPVDKRNPEGFSEAYEWAVSQGYDIIIFDSLSHAWHGALEQVDQMSRGGDKMRAWANMSPKQRQMIQTLTDPRAHCIVTMRVKTEFQESEGANGKKRMQKVGMKADQRDNTEYEFDLVLRFESGNECHVEKVRGCTAMNGKSATKPGPAFFKPLFDWWKSADEVPAQSASIDAKPTLPTPQSPKPQVQAESTIALRDSLTKQILDAESEEEVKNLMSGVAAQIQAGQLNANEDAQYIRGAAMSKFIKLAKTFDEVVKHGEKIDVNERDGKITSNVAERLRKLRDDRLAQLKPQE